MVSISLDLIRTHFYNALSLGGNNKATYKFSRLSSSGNRRGGGIYASETKDYEIQAKTQSGYEEEGRQEKEEVSS